MPASAATTLGLAEKLRPSLPIAGFDGLTFMSHTGAKFSVTPIDLSVWAMPCAHAWVAAAELRAPIWASERVAGNPSPGFNREIWPPS